DMDLFLRRIGHGIESIRTDPVQRLARSCQLHRDQLLSPDSRLQQTLHCRFARSVQMTDRFQTHDSLRLQGTIQQVVQSFLFGGRARQTFPTEKETLNYLLERALQSQGIVSLESICHL